MAGIFSPLRCTSHMGALKSLAMSKLTPARHLLARTLTESHGLTWSESLQRSAVRLIRPFPNKISPWKPKDGLSGEADRCLAQAYHDPTQRESESQNMNETNINIPTSSLNDASLQYYPVQYSANSLSIPCSSRQHSTFFDLESSYIYSQSES